MGRPSSTRVGWNPASNSEGREGFFVGEVQGRGGPLNLREENNHYPIEVLEQSDSGVCVG